MVFEYTPFNFHQKDILPDFIRNPENKSEQFLWEGVFREDTAQYIVIGSGNYRLITGTLPLLYRGDSKDAQVKSYVLEAVVLIHDVTQRLICGGKILDWGKRKLNNSKNPIHDFLFCMEDGRVAFTDFEKEEVIKKHIRNFSK